MELTFSNEFLGTLLRFAICVLVNWSIINLLYFKKSHRRDFYFTFMLMTVAIFFLVYFMMGMERGKATMGVGLGLFVIICLSVVHAMAEAFAELLTIDIITFAAIWFCEQMMKPQCTKLIQYDRIELIKPEKRDELIADLEARTGLKIKGVEVGGIDFLKDSTVLRVTYENDRDNSVDSLFTVKKSQWREV